MTWGLVPKSYSGFQAYPKVHLNKQPHYLSLPVQRPFHFLPKREAEGWICNFVLPSSVSGRNRLRGLWPLAEGVRDNLGAIVDLAS